MFNLYKAGTAEGILILLIIFSYQSSSAQTLPITPDTIMVNGRVITADSDDPEDVSIAEAIAIRDGKIIAVGSNSEIRALAVSGTEVVDVNSRTVIPGLIDNHLHLYNNALGFPWASDVDPQLLNILLTVKSEDEGVSIAEAAIRARAKGIDAGKWISVRLNPSNIAHSVFGDRITR